MSPTARCVMPSASAARTMTSRCNTIGRIVGDSGRPAQTIKGSDRTHDIDAAVGSWDKGAQRGGHGLRGAADAVAHGSAQGAATGQRDDALGAQPAYDRQANKQRAQDKYTPPTDKSRAKPGQKRV